MKSAYAFSFQLPLVPEQVLARRRFAALRFAFEHDARRGAFTSDDVARYVEAWARPGALTAMLNWYRALARRAGSLQRRRSRAPVRVVWGDRDPFLERGLVEAGLALCERGEAFHLPEATHWVQHEEPERVNRLLLEFLA